jgi:hypothetical protein
MLQTLTIQAVKATSIAHHLQRGEMSHFNTELSDTQRLAELGELLGKVFDAAAVAPDPAKLQQALLWLAATAAIWAELIDTDKLRHTLAALPSYMPDVPVKIEMHQRFKEGGIIQ